MWLDTIKTVLYHGVGRQLYIDAYSSTASIVITPTLYRLHLLRRTMGIVE